MGFNLKIMFEELESLFEKDLNAEDLILEIKVLVKEAKQYARECGQIN